MIVANKSNLSNFKGQYVKYENQWLWASIIPLTGDGEWAGNPNPLRVEVSTTLICLY